MKARLAFAVSINIDPEILILDEILAVGDELFKRKCFARMEKFFKGGKTILFVSHSVQSINQICTKAVFLNKGEIILKGPTKMVTAQYERYLYSQKENKDKVRNEIKLINQGTESKENYFQQVNTGKKETIKQNNKAEASEFNKKSTVKNYAAFASENKKTSKTVEENSENAFFIPNFKPKSQVEYREADVDIHDIKILDQEGRQVNVLMPGEKYFYEYKVRFNIDASNVVFGMMIKTEKGVNLASTNSQQYSTVIKHILNNTSYTVSWAFVCNMLQGNYYTNAGVSEFKDGKHIYLNRIVDAMVFKVRSQKSLSYNGLIKIDLHPEIEEL
ncbi:MAG: Wzt carbohydrate-binding domain-containing protein [Bacteroidales bacterium]|nr:Wzt carbohydrate-binding domain-containing protein [Bacteroidales bacterium]